MASLASEDVFKNAVEGQKLSTANTKFSLVLYRHQAGLTSGNVFMSPLSISIALAMTYLGARNNTKNQMAEVLHFGEVEEAELHQAFNDIRESLNKRGQPYKLHMANRLFGEKSFEFLDEYLKASMTHYGAQLEPVDFAKHFDEATDLINRWVSDQTAEKIPNLIPRGVLNALTRLVLVNAVYFKGDWSKKFDKELTKLEDFHVSSTEKARVHLMHLPKAKLFYGVCQELNSQAVELPYAGDRLSMIILLPFESSDLQKLESSLSAEDIVNVDQKFRLSQREVNLWLPRFKLDEKLDLTAILETLGMTDMFDRDLADFSGIDGKRQLFVSKVLHQAVVDVNEEGTEAAAATAVVMMLRCALPKDPFEFRADRPFLFFIRDNLTKSILFLGRLVKPANAD